jgi:hypothetical protein
MKKKLIVLSGFVLGFAPVIALAQDARGCTGLITSGGNQNLITVICKVNQIIGVIVPVLIALGVVYFIWGVISYVIGTDEETKKSAREKIIYGIIGLAVIVAVWGLVQILTRTFGVDGPSTVVPPVVPGYNN